jgi:CRP-like cAMP-binding protein
VDDKNKKELFLSSSRLFGGLSFEDIRKISSMAEITTVKKKEMIYREGDPAERFYFVMDGKVKIYKEGSHKKKQLLRFILPGESFAEAAMFAGGPYPASAASAQDTELISFPRNAFLTIVRKNPELSLRLLGSLSRFCRYFIDLLEDLSLRSVPSRVAAYILARGQNRILKPGDKIDLGISKGELASRLGIVNETLSRTLKKFKDDGIIKINRREVKILKPDKLRAMVTQSHELH